MDAILNQATANLERDVQERESTPDQKVEEVSEEEEVEDAVEEESNIEEEEEEEESVLQLPREMTAYEKFFQIRTVKGPDGNDIHPWWVKGHGEHGKLRTVDVMERWRARMKRRRDAWMSGIRK